MNNLLIVGNGGQGKVVLDCALQMNIFDNIAFLLNNHDYSSFAGFDCFYEDENTLNELLINYKYIIVAFGNNRMRLSKINYLLSLGFEPAILIHPTATVSKFAEIGKGTVVFANAVINPFARIGKACIINTSSIIEHDCILSDGVHISPNSAVGGETIIGKETWVCVGCSIANGIKLGSNVTVGTGAAVINDFGDNVLIAGVPAVIKKYYNS